MIGGVQPKKDVWDPLPTTATPSPLLVSCDCKVLEEQMKGARVIKQKPQKCLLKYPLCVKYMVIRDCR